MIEPTDSILLGATVAGQRVSLLPKYLNRHGLIAGATGTGKTVTLQVLAEALAERGVPVFMADVKGDLAGLAAAGAPLPPFVERARALGLALDSRAMPVLLWDLFARQGHPVRTTISEFGPLLLSRLLDLNEVQSGVLALAFKVADDEGLLLLDLKDLRALLAHVAERAAELNRDYGSVSAASVGAIQRALLALEQQGAEALFGEPALDLFDLMRSGPRGAGCISILAADQLMQRPRLYATFLLWLLSELYETLPEAGDLPQPKLVLVFDEAHLLFDDAPKALVEKVEQVVRLVRSKGIGVWFVTQNPLDIPDSVLGQLGNRIQHALRAFTPRDQRAVKVAAETFRQNPAFSSVQAITELAVGEALVSVLDAKGAPTPVERVLIRPPASRVGPLKPEERDQLNRASPVAGKYDRAIDRESAFERLRGRAEPAPAPRPGPVPDIARSGPWSRRPEPEPAPARQPPASRRQGRSTAEQIATSVATSVARSMGTQVGRAIMRGVLGSIFRR
jgi:DNA helicase HerA-like ATPase